MASFGVHLSGFSEDPRRFGELCGKVEEWGFDSVWLADGLTRNTAEPLPALAYASAFTHRVKLGTCIYVIPIRHPLVTAKLASTLDRASKGRFILGVGVGWKEDEFKATGVPFEQRGKVTDECLQIICQAWETGHVEFKGDFYNIPEVKMEFQPAQKPRPQLWIGGNGSQAMTRATRFGDYWIPTDYTIDEYKQGVPRLAKACKRFGRDSGQVKVASHLMVIVDKDRNKAESSAKNVADSLHTELDELKEWAIVGDTKNVTNRIEAYNAAGVEYHVLNFGTKVRDEAGIELFARNVLPSFT
ncbi:MAG: LLM class flavin-dependent oxidoreductase [Candidatus Bathyarchaeia archaeon]